MKSDSEEMFSLTLQITLIWGLGFERRGLAWGVGCNIVIKRFLYLEKILLHDLQVGFLGTGTLSVLAYIG